jgi:hypothetical protein
MTASFEANFNSKTILDGVYTLQNQGTELKASVAPSKCAQRMPGAGWFVRCEVLLMQLTLSA